MKTKKFSFDWRSMVLGIGLCLALVVFVASVAQVSQDQSDQGVFRRAATTNDVLAKCEVIDQRILLLEGKMNECLRKLKILLKEDK